MVQLYLVRLPNILQFQPRPFDPETFEDDDGAGDEEEGSKARAENAVRWRETATGERQSNARLVRWSDGSMTLHVGGEVLLAQQVPIPEGSTHLYTRHANRGQGANLECHGVLNQKMTLAPASLHSKTHQALSQNISRYVPASLSNTAVTGLHSIHCSAGTAGALDPRLLIARCPCLSPAQRASQANKDANGHHDGGPRRPAA